MTLSKIAQTKFRFDKLGLPSRRSFGIVYLLKRNKGFFWRKFWRFLWELIEVGVLSYSLAPTGFSILWVVPLSILLISNFIDILFHTERYLMNKGYSSLTFKRNIIWLVLSWLIFFYVLSFDLVDVWQRYPWVRWYLVFKGGSLFIRQLLSLWNLPYSTRMRPYFPQIVYPLTILSCLILSVLSYIYLYGAYAYISVLAIWSLGAIVPEILFTKKVIILRKLKWFSSKTMGKRCSFFVFLKSVMPWLYLMLLPFYIVRIQTNEVDITVTTFFGTICLFYIVERWVLRLWRSYQLDAFKSKDKENQNFRRANQIRLLSLIVLAPAIIFIGFPWFTFIRFDGSLELIMLLEIIVYCCFCLAFIEIQTIDNKKNNVKLFLFLTLILYLLMLFSAKFSLVLRLMLVLYYFIQSFFNSIPFVGLEPGRKVLKIRFKRQGNDFLHAIHLTKKEVVIPVEQFHRLKDQVEMSLIDELREDVVPQPLELKSISDHVRVIKAQNNEIRTLTEAKPNFDKYLLMANMGIKDGYPIYRLIKNKKIIFIQIIDNIIVTEKKLRDSWFIVS